MLFHAGCLPNLRAYEESKDDKLSFPVVKTPSYESAVPFKLPVKYCVP
jgi:hypothetical protein